MKNELRRHKSSLERSENQHSRQKRDMSPLKNAAALPLGILVDENDERYKEGFIQHLQQLQRSSKKLTPERRQGMDNSQSRQSLGLNHYSLKSSGPYHYLQWSKAQSPEKSQKEESHLKELL